MIGKKLRRMAAIVLSTVMAATTTQLCAINTAWADEYPAGSYTITCDDKSGYEYDSTNEVLKITGGGEFSLTPNTPGNGCEPIKVTSDDDVTITLEGVQISTDGSRAPFEINAEGNVTIKLAADSRDGGSAENVLKISDYNSDYRYAALQKTSTENELIITSASGNSSTDGILKASGDVKNSKGRSVSGGAGIGGIYDINLKTGGAGKNITINGGTITATGGKGSAGIGGGRYADGSNITINGGNVTATGGMWAAGIGGGEVGDGTDITITGGTVTATVAGCGAGIGGGCQGNGSNITISGGTVTATGGNCDDTDTKGGGAAGIGGGQSGDGSNITISGGTVTAQSGENGIAGVGAGARYYNKLAGTSSDINISPVSPKLISAQYGTSGTKYYYSAQTDVTDLSGNNGYFSSETIDLSTLKSDTMTIQDSSSGGTKITDGDNNTIADGDLSNVDIDISSVTAITTLNIIGGKVGTITPGAATTVNVSGAPKCSIVMKSALNITGNLTSASGDIKLLNCTAGDVVANISDSAYAQIGGTKAAGYAFTATDANGDALALETTNDAITAKALDTYTLSCTAKDSEGNNTLTDINAGETFTLDVALMGGGSNVGSAQFALTGDWYTVNSVSVPTGATVETSDDKTQVAITGLGITTSTDAQTIATLKLVAKADVADGDTGEIGFSSPIITATNSTGEVTPATTDCSVTLHNVIVTLNAGNAVFDSDSTKTSVTAYAKYNTAGLYSDEARSISLTLPEVTASTGYRLAAGTDADPLWKDANDTAYKDSAAVAAVTFTAPVTLTAQTTKQYTVTINDVSDADRTKGNITKFTGEYKYDENTALATIVSGITLQDATEGTYTITGWTAVDTNGTVTVNDTTSYKLHSDITITPIVGVIEHTIGSIVQRNAVVSGISDSDSVPYGEDVSFVVTAAEGCRVYSVQYTVGSNAAEALPYSANGVYTIPGTAITGDIGIEVYAKQYSTIMVQAGVGNTITSATYYAWADSAGLYTSLDGLGDAACAVDETTLKGDLAAETGYRLADDTTEEPLWSDGTTGYTTASVLGTKFTADTTLIANAIKTHNVTFTAGQNGSLSGTTTYTIDDGKTLTALPTAAAADYYVFDRWAAGGSEYTDDELKALPITEDMTVTAEFTPASYNVTFTTSELADFTPTSGVYGTNGAYTGTYLTDITFELDEKTVAGQQIDYVYYTVDTDETKNTITPDSSGVYTIDGGAVKGNITVSIEAEGVRTITFVSNDATRGTVGGTTSFIVVDGETLSKESFEKVTYTPLAGYTFTNKWENSSDETVDEDTILAENGTDDVTYTAVFDYADYLMTDTNSIVSVESGVVKEDDNGKHVQYDTDIVFTITAPVTEIGYTVDGEDKGLLTASSEGKYTIPGTAIVGNIEIYSTVVKTSGGANASFTFISKEEYIGDGINAFSDDRKIVVLDAAKEASGNYKLSDGREFFYSSSLGGYVMIVGTAETVETLSAMLRFDASASIKEISYDGDLNGSGTVTAGDAGMLNDILSNNWTQVVTDEQLFMLDTSNNGDGKYVYTSDITDILKKAIDAMG